MRRDDYLRAIKQLDLQAQDYIVVGSGVLSVLGLREAGDVDLVVSQAVYEEFEAAGAWRRKYHTDGTYGLTNGIYEAGLNWDSRNGEPNLRDLKRQEIAIDGVPFVDLVRLRAWKQNMGRPKDLADILLIDRYLSDLSKLVDVELVAFRVFHADRVVVEAFLLHDDGNGGAPPVC